MQGNTAEGRLRLGSARFLSEAGIDLTAMNSAAEQLRSEASTVVFVSAAEPIARTARDC